MTGASAGFALMKLGGVVIWIGRRRAAEVSADCTSSAAPSMLRDRSNCIVIELTPRPFDETIELPLQGSRDGRSHGLGRGARQGGVDDDGREIDFRNGRDRQQTVAEEAEDD